MVQAFAHRVGHLVGTSGEDRDASEAAARIDDHHYAVTGLAAGLDVCADDRQVVAQLRTIAIHRRKRADGFVRLARVLASVRRRRVGHGSGVCAGIAPASIRRCGIEPAPRVRPSVPLAPVGKNSSHVGDSNAAIAALEGLRIGRAAGDQKERHRAERMSPCTTHGRIAHDSIFFDPRCRPLAEHDGPPRLARCAEDADARRTLEARRPGCGRHHRVDHSEGLRLRSMRREASKAHAWFARCATTERGVVDGPQDVV